MQRRPHRLPPALTIHTPFSRTLQGLGLNQEPSDHWTTALPTQTKQFKDLKTFHQWQELFAFYRGISWLGSNLYWSWVNTLRVTCSVNDEQCVLVVTVWPPPLFFSLRCRSKLYVLFDWCLWERSHLESPFVTTDLHHILMFLLSALCEEGSWWGSWVWSLRRG